MVLRIIPLTLKQANELVKALHRHHKPAVGHRFSVGVEDETGVLHGAAIVGRPVGRNNPQYKWAEVTRLVTDGQKKTLAACCTRLAPAWPRKWDLNAFRHLFWRKKQVCRLEPPGGNSNKYLRAAIGIRLRVAGDALTSRSKQNSAGRKS